MRRLEAAWMGLLCMMDLCVVDDCVVGAADCPCDTDGVCNDDLYCAEDMRCRTCDANGVGCACTEADGCSDELVCDTDDLTCRGELTCEDDADGALGCGAQQLCDDGEDGEDAVCLEECEAGFEWDGVACVMIVTASCDPWRPTASSPTVTRRIGSAWEMGVGAMCGACQSGYVEEGMTCRALVTCADIGATCSAENRECTDGDGTSTDAACGDCVDPFEEDMLGACELPSDATCVMGEPQSIVDFCADQNRECFDPLDGTGAECGDCIAGFADNGGVCEMSSSCVGPRLRVVGSRV